MGDITDMILIPMEVERERVSHHVPPPMANPHSPMAPHGSLRADEDPVALLFLHCDGNVLSYPVHINLLHR